MCWPSGTPFKSPPLRARLPRTRFRRGACRYASLADLYCAFGMTFPRGCYHQILGPSRHLPKLSNGLCRHAGAYVRLNLHLSGQAAESYVERSNAFALVPGHGVLADCSAAEQPAIEGTLFARHASQRGLGTLEGVPDIKLDAVPNALDGASVAPILRFYSEQVETKAMELELGQACRLENGTFPCSCQSDHSLRGATTRSRRCTSPGLGARGGARGSNTCRRSRSRPPAMADRGTGTVAVVDREPGGYGATAPRVSPFSVASASRAPGGSDPVVTASSTDCPRAAAGGAASSIVENSSATSALVASPSRPTANAAIARYRRILVVSSSAR